MSLYLGNAQSFYELVVLGVVARIPDDLLQVNGLNATGMFIDVEGSPVRYRIDGLDPTSLVGHREVPSVNADATARISIVGGSNVRDFRVVSESVTVGSDLTVTLAYGGHGL